MPRQFSSKGGRAKGTGSHSNDAVVASPISSASKFLPTNLNELKVWLDASFDKSINSGSPHRSDVVSEWRDKRFNTAFLSTGSDMTWGTVELNGLSTINNTTAGTSYVQANMNGSTTNRTNFTIFIVFNGESLSGLDAYLSSDPDETNDVTVGIYAGGGKPQLGVFSSGAIQANGTSQLNISQWYRACITQGYLTGGRWQTKIYLDNVLDSTTDNTTLQLPTTSVLVFGGNLGAYTIPSGNIAEVVVYGYALPTNDRNLVDTYLKKKWGL